MSSLAARTTTLLLGIVAAAHGATAQAQEPVAGPRDAEIEAIRFAYEYGRYANVVERAQERIDRGGLSAEGLVELHKYAGLSAFNLGQRQDAQRHFGALLRLQPDFALDPFAVPPPAIAAFEAVRKELAPQLDLIRQQLRLDAERRRQEAEERERLRRTEEERRRRLEEMSRRVTVRTIKKNSFLVNFVPFGAGQFQQDRPVAGLLLASLEGALALTSIVAYLAYNGLLERSSVVVDTVPDSDPITRVGIPQDSVDAANVWRVVKYVSAGAFYTLYGYGVVDALYHYEDETISESTIQLSPEPEPPGESPPDSPRTPVPERLREERTRGGLVPHARGLHASVWSTPSPRPFLFLTPGGLGAGLNLRF